MMSEENNGQNNQSAERPRLSLEDPVAPEVLGKLRALQEARMDVGDRHLTLQQEQVRLLAAARRIDEEKQRVFEALLMERGLPPDTVVEIDAGTGKVKVLQEGQPPIPKPPTPEQPTAEPST